MGISPGNTIMISFKQILAKSFLAISLALLFVIGLLLSTAHAHDPISGHYTSVDGSRAELVIQIGSPAPSSLIIQQFFPPQNTLRKASPAPGKLQRGQGVAKWFFKNPRPGTFVIRLDFQNRISPQSLRAIIRCKQPNTGRFIEKQIRP
jgi:hypothetical protein